MPRPRKKLRPGEWSVERAARFAQQTRDKRAEVVESLPNVRNPTMNLRARGERDFRAAPRGYSQARQSQAIREQIQASKVQAVGRRVKSSIRGNAERPDLRNVMDREQRRRFDEAMRRLQEGTQQSLGLLFAYAGGQEDFDLALERIKYPRGDPDEGFDMLERLADLAELAADAYSPKAIGRITV